MPIRMLCFYCCLMLTGCSQPAATTDEVPAAKPIPLPSAAATACVDPHLASGEQTASAGCQSDAECGVCGTDWHCAEDNQCHNDVVNASLPGASQPDAATNPAIQSLAQGLNSQRTEFGACFSAPSCDGTNRIAANVSEAVCKQNAGQSWLSIQGCINFQRAD